jgi:hypothetical protein
VSGHTIGEPFVLFQQIFETVRARLHLCWRVSSCCLTLIPCVFCSGFQEIAEYRKRFGGEEAKQGELCPLELKVGKIISE